MQPFKNTIGDMTLACALKGDHAICYRFRYEMGYIKLRLWEPPTPDENRDSQRSPYLYAANLTFRTMQEAEAFLHGHLLSNGAFDVPETDFPKEGRIEILPFPTWQPNPS